MCSEFSTSSQASADSALALSKRADLKLSRSAKLSHSPAASSPVTGPTCPVMTTCKPSPQSDLLPMALPLMSSAAGFPAKTSAQPERAQGLPVSDPASGQRLPDWLASYDPATSSWKTSQLCLDGALEPYSETWPRSGMTQSGIAYRLPPLVPLTAGTASGLWPTPNTSEAKSDTHNVQNRIAKGKQVMLCHAVRLWPTPDAMVANLSEDLDNWTARRDRVKAKKKNGNGFGMPLAVAVRMWPTASARDWKDTPGMARTGTNPDGSKRQRADQLARAVYSEQDSHKGDGSLNPTWVEWLMGFPLGWTDLKASATPSSPKSPNSSATPSSKRKRAANPIQPGE